MGIMLSMLVPKSKAHIAQRKYDNLWALYAPVLEVHEDKSWTFNWETRGVFENKKQAEKALSELQ